MLQLHIVFVLFAAKAGCGTLTPTSDRLSVAVVGERVPFSCRIDGSTGNISWIYYRTGSKKEHTIHTGRKMNPAFEAMFTVNANRSSGASELIAHSVTSAESGMYLCSETHTAVTRVDFELVVIESTPKCQLDVRQRRFPASVDTDDQLRVNCSVPYSGNVAPSFRCDPQFRGEQVSNDADVSTHVVSYSKRVNALMMNATTHLTCRAMLNSTMRDGRAAIKYFYSWNSTDVFGSNAGIYVSDITKTARTEARIDSLLIIVVTLVSVISLLVLTVVGACVVVICRQRRSAAAAESEYDDACTAASAAPPPDGMTHIQSSSVPPDVTTGSKGTQVGASDANLRRAPSNGSSVNSNVSEHNYSEIREVNCENSSDARVKSTSGYSTGIYMELERDDEDIQRQAAVPSVYATISAAATLPPRPPRIAGDSGQAVGLRASGDRRYRSASGKVKRVRLPPRTAVADVH